MRVLVSDTSIFIDLERADLLEVVFRLPFGFAVPDVLYRREIEPNWGSTLLALGLQVEEVSAEGVASALRHRAAKPVLSVPDIFAFALAQERQWTLLTGDAALRELADAESLPCHGVLWLFDEMEKHAIVASHTLYHGLKAVGDHPRCRLPKREIASRLERFAAKEAGGHC